MKKKKDIKIIISLIIILFSFLLISIILVKNKERKEKEDIITTSSPDSQYVKEALHIIKKGKYTGYCSLGATHYLSFNLKLPELTIAKSQAKKLNELILSDYKTILDLSSEKNLDINDNKFSATLKINSFYKYLIKEDIIYFYIVVNYIFPRVMNYSKVNNYYYDLKNNQILNFKDVINNTDFTLNDFKKLDSKINLITDCENNLCGFKIENDKLIPFINAT